MEEKPQENTNNETNNEEFIEKAKKRLKTRKENAKKKRPEYKKKRVFVPIATAAAFNFTRNIFCNTLNIFPINR